MAASAVSMDDRRQQQRLVTSDIGSARPLADPAWLTIPEALTRLREHATLTSAARRKNHKLKRGGAFYLDFFLSDEF